MTKKSLLLVLFAIALATIYAIWFSDWFRPKTIQIYHRERQMSARGGGTFENLVFGLRPKSRITELKVVSLSEFETNKDAVPVWHLISDSNSLPMNMFSYGQYIPGMRPVIKGARADALEANVTYRMFLTAAGVTGQHDFELK